MNTEFLRRLLPRSASSPAPGSWAPPTGPGHHRSVAIRRFAALSLLITALLLAVTGGREGGPAVLVFTQALEAGQPVGEGDVELRTYPAALAPESALSSPEDAHGLIVVASATAGEPVTPGRLLDSHLVEALAGPDSTLVPVNLAEPEVTALLHHGDTVSIVTVAGDSEGPGLYEDDSEPRVIADGARVVATGEAATGRADTVLVALDSTAGLGVAAASLSHPLAIVLTSPAGH